MKEFVRLYWGSVWDISKYYEMTRKKSITETWHVKIKAAGFKSFNISITVKHGYIFLALFAFSVSWVLL